MNCPICKSNVLLNHNVFPISSVIDGNNYLECMNCGWKSKKIIYHEFSIEDVFEYIRYHQNEWVELVLANTDPKSNIKFIYFNHNRIIISNDNEKNIISEKDFSDKFKSYRFNSFIVLDQCKECLNCNNYNDFCPKY